MRISVNVLWLEDRVTGENRRPHNNRVKCVESHIKSKGYRPNINVVKTIDKAREALQTRDGERRYDFFISDFDLGGGITAEKGLDYLVSVRKSNNFKRFFLLYSRNEYSTISRKISEKLKLEENINLFTNFSFVSIKTDDNYTINDIEQKFKAAIDIGLSRWDELNAIRGMYMSEHAEIESKLRKAGCFGEYEQMISYFCTRNAVTEDVSTLWQKQRKIRNALAHVTESFDHRKKCFFIESNEDKSVKIFENDLDSHRNQLKQLRESLESYFK